MPTSNVVVLRAKLTAVSLISPLFFSQPISSTAQTEKVIAHNIESAVPQTITAQPGEMKTVQRTIRFKEIAKEWTRAMDLLPSRNPDGLRSGL